MNAMNVKRVKRLCTVKGCKNTDSYAISRSSEMGGIIICRDCLTAALEAAKLAEESGAAKASAGKKELRPTGPLFYHPEKARQAEKPKKGGAAREKAADGGKTGGKADGGNRE